MQLHRASCARAFEIIEPLAVALFQARKIGIQAVVPIGVREHWLALYGVQAERLLDYLDGNISLMNDWGFGPRSRKDYLHGRVLINPVANYVIPATKDV